MSEALALLPASEQVARLRRGELSAEALLAACLARVDRLDPELGAVVTRNERAHAEAAAVDAALARGEDPGPLAGLPVGIKDVTETAGIRTTYGSTLYADHVPHRDAEVVTRLRAAGAVILGKTNTPEFAAGGNTWNEVFGRTRNPWDPALSAGGSTGGGAVGLATGMISLAQGTDLGGSLRIPASFCGVVGLRPAPGLVPTHPSWFLWDTLQVTGPMARTAEDAALMLGAIAGPSARFPLAQPVAGRDFVRAARAWDPAGARIAYAPDVAGIGIDRAVASVCRGAVEALAGAGAEVEEVALDLSWAREPFLALRGLWFLAHLWDDLDRLEELGPNVAGNVRAGLETSARDVAAGERARRRAREELERRLDRFDLLATPCMAVPPFSVERNYPETIAGRPMETYIDWVAPTFVLNMAGLPVGSVPAGLDAAGLPVGLQVVGPALGEEAVLGAMAAVQALRPLGAPPIARDTGSGQ